MNLQLHSLSNYFGMWKFKLNEIKSSLVVIMGFVKETNYKMRRGSRHMKIRINGHILEHYTQIKLLGVFLSRNNRFVRHVDYVLGKARRSFFALRLLIRSKLIDPCIRVNINAMSDQWSPMRLQSVPDRSAYHHTKWKGCDDSNAKYSGLPPEFDGRSDHTFISGTANSTTRPAAQESTGS